VFAWTRRACALVNRENRTEERTIRQEPAPRGIGLIGGHWIALGLGLSFLALLALLRGTGLRVGATGFAATIPLYVVGLAGWTTLRMRNATTPMARTLRDAAEYYGAFIAICLLGAFASYPLAAETTGYSDAYLSRADRIFGFDWLAWYQCVAAHPALQVAGRAAYQSIYVTPAILLAYFAWTGRKPQARIFIASFWIAALLTLLLFLAVPAKGPLAVLWHGRIPYWPVSALYQAHLIPQLRTHALRLVDLQSVQGVVCAPSFHAAAAVLFIAAAWPVRILRWPLLAVNALMILATPVEGTHYLTDILVGMAVALVATAAARSLSSRMSAGGRRTASRTAPALAIVATTSGPTAPAAAPALMSAATNAEETAPSVLQMALKFRARA
jgi:membrane-associated phospholipid phosphatase